MRKMETRKKQYGFTLVELLAVIVIISVIFGVAGYAVISAIRGSKSEVSNISLESIKKSAVLYAKEGYGNWIDDVDYDYDYMCVSILDLVNKGFLKEKDIEEVTYNYIQLNRDENMVIIEDIDGTKCELE